MDTVINCTCKNRLGFSLLSFTLIPQYFKRFNWSKTYSKKWNLKTKQWNPLSLRLFLVGSMTSWSFQTVRRMREAWQRETDARYQSFSPKSAVKYIHVGRRKIQISLPPGEQHQSNALPQGQQRQSNPHPMPCPHPPPAGITLIGALH